jgi:poly-gamma-glutamate synthesis protein (capsule biosynthesis protein)
VNLEVVLTTAPHPAEKLVALKADPHLATIIRELGIDVMTVANNHGMDYGAEGLRECLGALDKAGILHCGGGENLSQSLEPALQEINGCKIAYIGVTTTLPNGSGAGKNRPGMAPVRVFTKYVIDTVTLDETPGMSPFAETTTYAEDQRHLLKAIQDARDKADLVVVAIHWGVPYGWVAQSQDEIAGYQQPLAHAMVDAGASAIFGHHPHVVHGVEFYKSAPIFYSLGNFLFHNVLLEHAATIRSYPNYSWASLQSNLSNIGGLAKVSWESGRLATCSLIPVSINAVGEPEEASLVDAELLLARVNHLSKNRGVAFELIQTKTGFEIKILGI